MKKTLSLIILGIFLSQQTGFAQLAPRTAPPATSDPRPAHLRYLSLEPDDSLRILFDKGSRADTGELDLQAPELLRYFLVGLALPDDAFWVNLRPDSPDRIIDADLAKTDVGKVMLEADLQLKKDIAAYTLPATEEGRMYWEKLYRKAEELFGANPAQIPTLSRPWIVPGRIILMETATGAYIFKAQLQVMLEQDYMTGSPAYDFRDHRLKELNEYSAGLLRELIVPKMTRDINSSGKYAALRQVYYSLILAQWFKQAKKGTDNEYCRLIDSRKLDTLTSAVPTDVAGYYKEYTSSFASVESGGNETVYSGSGVKIRNYSSGGINFEMGSPLTNSGMIGDVAFTSLESAPYITEGTMAGTSGQVRFSPTPKDGGSVTRIREPSGVTVNATFAYDERYWYFSGTSNRYLNLRESMEILKNIFEEEFAALQNPKLAFWKRGMPAETLLMDSAFMAKFLERCKSRLAENEYHLDRVSEDNRTLWISGFPWKSFEISLRVESGALKAAIRSTGLPLGTTDAPMLAELKEFRDKLPQDSPLAKRIAADPVVKETVTIGGEKEISDQRILELMLLKYGFRAQGGLQRKDFETTITYDEPELVKALGIIAAVENEALRQAEVWKQTRDLAAETFVRDAFAFLSNVESHHLWYDPYGGERVAPEGLEALNARAGQAVNAISKAAIEINREFSGQIQREVEQDLRAQGMEMTGDDVRLLQNSILAAQKTGGRIAADELARIKKACEDRVTVRRIYRQIEQALLEKDLALDSYEAAQLQKTLEEDPQISVKGILALESSFEERIAARQEWLADGSRAHPGFAGDFSRFQELWDDLIRRPEENNFGRKMAVPASIIAYLQTLLDSDLGNVEYLLIRALAYGGIHSSVSVDEATRLNKLMRDMAVRSFSLNKARERVAQNRKALEDNPELLRQELRTVPPMTSSELSVVAKMLTGKSWVIEETPLNYLAMLEIYAKYVAIPEEDMAFIQRLKDKSQLSPDELQRLGRIAKELMGGVPGKNSNGFATARRDGGTEKPGGIDFRALQAQKLSSITGLIVTLEIAHAPIADIEAECARLDKLCSMGVLPSAQRVKEFAAACYHKGELTLYNNKMLRLVSVLLRDDETSGRTTDEDITAMLGLFAL